jgi:hypothetical protein
MLWPVVGSVAHRQPLARWRESIVKRYFSIILHLNSEIPRIAAAVAGVNYFFRPASPIVAGQPLLVAESIGRRFEARWQRDGLDSIVIGNDVAPNHAARARGEHIVSNLHIVYHPRLLVVRGARRPLQPLLQPWNE